MQLRILTSTLLGFLLACPSEAKLKQDRHPQDPHFHVDQGYCVLAHVGQGPTSLSQSCDDFLHERFPKEGTHMVQGCGVDPDTNVQRTAYIALSEWHTPEHCRAGCETCMISMEDRQAKSAICRRKMGAALCAVAVVTGNPVKAQSLSCTPDQKWCELMPRGNQWMELGFDSAEDGVASGEVVTEYAINMDSDSPQDLLNNERRECKSPGTC